MRERSTVVELAGDAARGRVAAVVVVGLGVVACRLAQAYGVAAALATPLAGQRWTAGLGGLAVAAAAVLVRAGLLHTGERIADGVGLTVSVTIRRRLLEHLLRLGPTEVAGRRAGEVASMVAGGPSALEALVARARPAQIISWLGPLLAALAVGLIDPLSGMLLAAALVVVKVAPAVWNRIGKKAHDQVFADMASMDGGFVDAVQGMATAKALGATSRLRERLAGEAERVRVASMRTLNMLFTHMLLSRWALAGACAAVTVRTALGAANGDLSVRSALTGLLITTIAYLPVDDAGRHLHAAFAASAEAARMDAFLRERPARSGHPRATAQLGPAPVVELTEVSYRYPDREDDAVSDVSLQLRPGRTVALVGPSGSGKSTVVALLLGLLDPAWGRITVDGRDLLDIPPGQWWQRVAVVSQHTHLFPGSLRDNIALARPDATMHEIRAAASAAGLGADIARMPDGYDTEVAEAGARLSGGQRQRVAIARALLQDAPVLVLDEATSSLDRRTERAVHDAIAATGADRALLVVAHRLATVRTADEIVVLEHGRVVERGSHEQLLGSGGTYRRLVLAGSGGTR